MDDEIYTAHDTADFGATGGSVQNRAPQRSWRSLKPAGLYTIARTNQRIGLQFEASRGLCLRRLPTAGQRRLRRIFDIEIADLQTRKSPKPPLTTTVEPSLSSSLRGGSGHCLGRIGRLWGGKPIFAEAVVNEGCADSELPRPRQFAALSSKDLW